MKPTRSLSILVALFLAACGTKTSPTHTLESTQAIAAGLTSYQLQQENLADVVRGEATPIMPLAASVLNTYTIEALVTSALVGRTVDVEMR